ncbi:MAG: alpha/beta fold hydrolase [Oceanospirillaceae bacterium]|nr:alpha/beta fold hydrolase [Oceanospirillaceae bacterium]
MLPLTNEADIQVREVPLPTAAGHVLSMRMFSLPEPRAVLIMAGAMGVVQGCYEKFARFMAGQGFAVFTFDYAGSGASLHGHMRNCKSGITDWGEYDCQAVIDYAKAHYPQLKLHWVGHSVGGQLLGMTPNVNKIDNAVTVACGSGYWRENSPPTKRIAWLLWYFIAPVAVPVCGYFPGKRLNMVGDLPAKVMQQWRRWCRNPEYAVGHEGAAMRESYASVRVPITSLAFTDDEMMSERNVVSLHGFFRNAPMTMVRVSPAELGVNAVGHLGWFREKYREAIWAGKILPLLK